MSLNKSIPIFKKHPCTALGKTFLRNLSSRLAESLNFHFICFFVYSRVQSRWNRQNRPILTILNLQSKSARFSAHPIISSYMHCYKNITLISKRESSHIWPLLSLDGSWSRVVCRPTRFTGSLY